VENAGDIFTAIPADVLANLGSGGIVVLTVISILRGWLVPARSMNQILSVHEERLLQERSRGDEWKSAAQAAAERNDELASQLFALQEVGRTTNALIEGLRSAAGLAHSPGRGGEGP
jgi:hypothetical protein